MSRTIEQFGLSAALLTPFTASDEINVTLLGEHASGILKAGADSVTLFGTTGEGPSVSRVERRIGLEALLATDCPAEKIVLGICATSVADAAGQVAEGSERGVTRCLVLPLFYFKDVGDAGLCDWYENLLARTPPATKFILYNIPQFSGVALSPGLITHLVSHSPDRLIAVKDSSGDWDSTHSLLIGQELPVLVGDERHLHRAVALGGGGAISGFANLHPDRLKRVIETGVEDRLVVEEVERIVSAPVIPALKALLAVRSGELGWERPRPPLTLLEPDIRDSISGLLTS